VTKLTVLGTFSIILSAAFTIIKQLSSYSYVKTI
jgi:hypothetical protein